MDILTQILSISGKKYIGVFFEPIVFETDEIINNPKHEEYENMKNWVKGQD